MKKMIFLLVVFALFCQAGVVADTIGGETSDNSDNSEAFVREFIHVQFSGSGEPHKYFGEQEKIFFRGEWMNYDWFSPFRRSVGPGHVLWIGNKFNLSLLQAPDAAKRIYKFTFYPKYLVIDPGSTSPKVIKQNKPKEFRIVVIKINYKWIISKTESNLEEFCTSQGASKDFGPNWSKIRKKMK